MYRVYVQTDNVGNIISINSSAFLESLDGWTEIGEGDGDRFRHAQGNYFDEELFAHHGVPRYKLDKGKAVKRSQDEIDADIAKMEKDTPKSTEDELAELRRLILGL